ncbi:copper resistance CopC family protein [Candidatus Poriferisocius sp.]|uniref:copper resistance CopC family protein n=1 Tax=Candidatus Poriferisocius sp. TaxID=3101276 RepID=UPI003B02E01A
MRVRTQRAVAIVVALAIVMAILFSLLAVFSSGVDAHAEIRRSAPRPSQVVGGRVDRVELEFRESIRPHEANHIVLQYPDGTRRSAALFVDGPRAGGRFAPLTEPGDYTVEWGLVDDSDGDWTTEQFAFTYDPAAPPPEWLPEPPAGRSSGSGGTVVLVVVFAVAAVMAGWLFWPRRKRLRRA